MFLFKADIFSISFAFWVLKIYRQLLYATEIIYFDDLKETIFIIVRLWGTQCPTFRIFFMPYSLLWIVDWLTHKQFSRLCVDWTSSESWSSYTSAYLLSLGLLEPGWSFKWNSLFWNWVWQSLCQQSWLPIYTNELLCFRSIFSKIKDNEYSIQTMHFPNLYCMKYNLKLK